MSAVTADLGVVTAYGSALQGGFDGTYEEFCEMIAKTVHNYEGAISATEAARNLAQQYMLSAQEADASAESHEIAAARSVVEANTSATNAKASEQKAKEYADQTAGNVNAGNVTMYYDTDGDLCLSAVITV